MSKRICVWGASITQGYSDYEKGGWVQRLWLYFVNNLSACEDVFNLGISGATTSDIIERFNVEAKARNPKIIIFAVGNNDSLFDKSKNKHWTEVDEFEKNLLILINKAKEYTDKVIFIGLTDVVDKKTSPVSWNVNLHYSHKYVKRYDALIEKVAKKYNALYCPMFDLLNDDDLPDGLHPSAEGHKKMFLRIKDFLIKNDLIN